MANLRKTVSDYNKSLEKVKQTYSGLLGFTLNGIRQVEHATRNGFVYIRIGDNLSEVVQAFNDKVSPVYDLPVLITRNGNRWVVIGRDAQRYSDWGTSYPFLPKHSDTHSLNRDGGGGGDAVAIYPDQFMPLLVYPSGTLGSGNLLVAPYVLQRTSDFIYVGNTGTQNLLIYKPTNNQAIMGLVYLDTVSGNPGILINSGTTLAGTITGTSSVSPYIPYPSSIQEPLYAFRLVSGTLSLTWDNLYNARQFIGGGSGGSTGSSSGLPTFITGSVPFAGSNGILKENNPLFSFNEITNTLWIGQKYIPPGITPSDFRVFARATGVNSIGGIAIITAGTGTNGGNSSTVNGYHSRGTFEVPTPVGYGDTLLTIIGAGYDGSSWANAGRVRIYANSNWITGSNTESRMDFEVVPSGTSTRRVQLQLFGDNLNLLNSGTYNVNGIPHTHSGLGAIIPILTADPSSPTDGYTYYLRETTGEIDDGQSIGLLLALTYTGVTGTLQPLQLSVWDAGTSQTIRF